MRTTVIITSANSIVNDKVNQLIKEKNISLVVDEA